MYVNIEGHFISVFTLFHASAICICIDCPKIIVEPKMCATHHVPPHFFISIDSLPMFWIIFLAGEKDEQWPPENVKSIYRPQFLHFWVRSRHFDRFTRPDFFKTSICKKSQTLCHCAAFQAFKGIKFVNGLPP